MSANTGHGVSVALVTSGLSLDQIDVQEPTFEGSAIELPALDIDDGGVVPVSPGDTLAAGQIVVTVEDDPSYEPPHYVKQDVTVTHPAPAGLTNGQVNTYANAFVLNYERAAYQSNERRTGTLTIQVNDKPGITAAS